MQALRSTYRARIDGYEQGETPRLRRDRRAQLQAVPVSFDDDVEVAAEAPYRAGRVLRALGRDEGGVTTQTATLRREPLRRDRRAVGVVVLGEQVGRVPDAAGEALAERCDELEPGAVATAPARVRARRNDDGTWRSEVTLLFSGATSPEAERDFAAERQARERREVAMLAEKIQAFAERVAREAS